MIASPEKLQKAALAATEESFTESGGWNLGLSVGPAGVGAAASDCFSSVGTSPGVAAGGVATDGVAPGVGDGVFALGAGVAGGFGVGPG
jgi:hypothetical protein